MFGCHASNRPNHTFLSEHESGRSLTYQEAQIRVASAAQFFRRRGIEAGDRIAILLENSLEWVTTFLATQTIGAVAVPFNSRLTVEEIRIQIDHCDPKVIVVDQLHSSWFSTGESRIVRCEEVPTEGASNLLSTENIDEASLISYTSGTTGSPKGVVLSQRAVFLSSMTYAAIFNSGPDFSTAIAVPLFHNTGFIDGLGHAIVAGGSVDIYRRFSAKAISKELSTGRLSFFIGVPTMYHRILEQATPKVIRSKRPLWLAYGGAPMPATIAKNLSELFDRARLVNCYGMSEATSITHYLPAHLSEGRWDSIGIPVPGTSDRISATDELEVNSLTAMIGYWGGSFENKATDSQQWIRTGDCAYRDGSGFLRITGRVDDIINRGGEKVSPLQVESAITQLSGILDVVVIGVDDKDLGQTPAALVVTGNNDFDADIMRAALAEHLADFKIPAYIYRVGELPRNANGKLIREKVKQMIAEKRMPDGDNAMGTGT